MLREPVAADGGRTHRHRGARARAGGELRDRRRRARGPGATAERPQPQTTSPSPRRRSSPDGFDARRDARSRTYRYRLLRPPRVQPLRAGPRPLVAAPDRPRRPRRLRRRPPRHPRLHRLHPDPNRPRPLRPRRPRRQVGPEGEILAFRITADAFMRNMVRVLVGTMLEVGSGRRTVENFEQLLKGAPRTDGRRNSSPPRPVPGVGHLRLS